jgi:plasmid stabilization system protein ParE
MRDSPRPFLGQKLVAESTRPPDVSRALEYLDEAIEEAEAAARWYAERSSTAASGFADEIDTAIAAIEQNPEAWPPYEHGTRHYLLRRYPFSVVYRIETMRILVVAVAHGHRRPGYWASRLQIRPG